MKTDKLILKFIWKCREGQDSKESEERKRKMEEP